MRVAPPAVEVLLGSGRTERWVVSGLYAVATCVLVAWWLLRRQVSDGSIVGWLTFATVLGALGGWQVVRPVQGRLCWDGTAWRLRSTGRAGAGGTDVPLRAVQLQCDLGHWLLLRAVRDGRRLALWCCVSARQAGPAWHGLRLALYHRAPVAARSER